MKCKDIIVEYYNEENDQYMVIDINHKRRPRLTLRQIQKMRKTRNLERIESQNRAKIASKIYGKSDSESRL